jgi:hypothetical protein
MLRLETNVASVCFECFKRFRGMLQVFYMDVAKVDRNVLYVAMVVQYVASVCSKYFICFSNACCKCFYMFLQVFQMQALSVLFVFRYMFANVSS